MLEWVVSGSVLIAVVIALRFALRGKISLRLQYAMWALVLVRLLVPVSLGESSFGVAALMQKAAGLQDVGAKGAVVQEGQMPAGGSAGEVQEAVHTEGAGEGSLPAAAHGQQAAVGSLSSEREEDAAGDMFKAVWLTGTVLLGLVLLASNARFAVTLRKSRRRLEGVSCRLPVYVSPQVDTPCLFGLLAPAIYVTPEAAGDEVAFGHAVEHELTHFRHGDHIWALLRGACLAVHWYNPMVWWAAVLSLRDAELACDEATIRALGEENRAAYARALLRLTCGTTRRLPTTATTMAGSPRALRERITRIARPSRRKAGVAAAVLVLAAAAVGCTFHGSLPSGAVPVQRDFTGDVPEAVVSLAESSLSQFIANWNYDKTGLYESHVTVARIIGMTPVQTGVSFGNAGVDVYHMEYRLHVKGDLRHLLPAWSDAVPSLTGGVWLTEYRRPSYYAFYWEEANGETTWQLADQITSDSLFYDYRSQNPEASAEECVQAFAWEAYAQHHNGASVKATFSEEIPQEASDYVPLFLSRQVGAFQKTLTEAGSDGAITQAEITALTPVVTQEASDTDGVVVYRVDYRLQGEGNLAPLLDQGMAAETTDGVTWLTPENSPGQLFCAFCWTIRDGKQLWSWMGDATPADLQSRYSGQGASLQAQLDAFAADMLGP